MTLSDTFIAAINRNALLERANIDQRSQGIIDITVPSSERCMFASGERLQALHDALAELLAREEQSRRVAVGITLSVQGLKIFIASDRNKDLDVLNKHFRNVWEALRVIKAKSFNPPDANKGRSSEDEDDLRRLVYEYSWNKHVQRYKHYKDSTIQNFLAEVLDLEEGESHWVVASRGERRTGYILKEELQTIKILRAVCRIMDKCVSGMMPDRNGLDGLALSILLLNHRLKHLGKDVVSRWAVVHRMIANFRGSRDALPKFIDKLCSIERAIREVIRVSLSSSILDAHLDVVLVEIQPVPLKYNLLDSPDIREITGQNTAISEIFENEWRDSASDCQEPWKVDQTVYPHCECALAAYLVSDTQADTNGNARPYGFIGVSEPSCAGCWLYISVYNDIADQHGLPKFTISEYHTETYALWARPIIADKELDTLIETRLCARVRDILEIALREEEKIRREHLEARAVLKQIRETGNLDVELPGLF